MEKQRECNPRLWPELKQVTKKFTFNKSGRFAKSNRDLNALQTEDGFVKDSAFQAWKKFTSNGSVEEYLKFREAFREEFGSEAFENETEHTGVGDKGDRHG